LAIVKKIMEDHGGALMLEDQPNGPGALASLVLPRAMAVAATSNGQAHGENGPNGRMTQVSHGA
jgi:two-component system nitrogen regulation sensor histidine kinase NtrY